MYGTVPPQIKGLIKQHIDSFNYFIGKEIEDIVMANQKVQSEVDSNFYLKYVDLCSTFFHFEPVTSTFTSPILLAP